MSSEIVDVVLTLNGRDVPRKAYSAIGTVATDSPTSTGSPASEAYATHCGTTTHAVITPATRSRRSHAGW